MSKKIQYKLLKARQLLDSERYTACMQLSRKLLRKNNAPEEAYNLYAVASLRSGSPATAIVILKQGCKQYPQSATIHYNLALCYQRTGQHSLAIKHFLQTLSIAPHLSAAQTDLSLSLIMLKRYDEAIMHAEASIKAHSHNPRALNNLGLAHERQGKYHDAEHFYEKATEQDPACLTYRLNLSQLLINRGDIERASSHLNIIINSQQAPGIAYLHLSHITTSKYELQKLAERIKHLNKDTHYNSSTDQADLNFALATIHDKLGQYEKAFQHYQKGNAFYDDYYKFNMDAFLKKTLHNVSFYDKKTIDDCRSHAALISYTPVFIIGMPRSGTSLVEKILTSHPGIHACGERTWFNELEKSLAEKMNKSDDTLGSYLLHQCTAEDVRTLADDYIREISAPGKNITHITDKLPENFIRVGLICSILKNAKFIYCRRNPVATCFSIYQQRFAGSIHWGYNLSKIERYFLLHAEVMGHWKKVFEEKIHTVNYEDLVDNPEDEVRTILNFIELPFHKACMEFHKNKSHTHTASDTQVNKPIYTRAKMYWKHYESMLAHELSTIIDTSTKLA